MHKADSKRADRVRKVKTLLLAGEGARALQVLGDRSFMLILRDAFLGVRRFEVFRRLTGIARGTLTQRLNTLVEQGIFYRSPYGRAPSQLEYRLTDKGIGLYPFALMLWKWDSHWSSDRGLPPRLLHSKCGKAFHPILVCAHCDEMVDPHAVVAELGPGARSYSAHPKGKRRLRAAAGRAAPGMDTTMQQSVEAIGDRWTVLLLASLSLGLHRYDDISAAMDCATNILADRLRRLLDSGIIERRLYLDRPPRHEYRLTQKGWDLYPSMIAMHDWASLWVPSPFGPGLKMVHQSCGHPLRSKVICDQCATPIDAHSVEVQGTRAWVAARKAPV